MNKKLWLLALNKNDSRLYDSMIELKEFKTYVDCLHFKQSFIHREFVNLIDYYSQDGLIGYIGKCPICEKIYYFLP